MKFSLFAAPALMGAAFAAPTQKRQVSQVVSVVEGLYAQVKSITGVINSTTAGVDTSSTGLPVKVTADISVQIEQITALVDKVLNATSDLTDLSDNIISELTTTVFTAVGDVTNVAGGAASGVGNTASGAVSGAENTASTATGSGLTSSLSSLTGLTGGILRRQIPDVAGVVTSLIIEVSGTLDGVQGIGALDSVLGAVEPLTSSLSTLLGDLDATVGGVAATVQNLLQALPISLNTNLLNGLPILSGLGL